jgi:hypothetical protein
MGSSRSNKMKWLTALSLLNLVALGGDLFAQTGKNGRSAPQPPGSQFIVAFELLPERGFKYVWPYESMKPAPYESVLMLVDAMPRVVNRAGRSRVLRASESLKVNGRTPKPLPKSRPSDGSQRFVVKLSEGRLRFSLTIPEGYVLDREYRTARIKLYQNE